MERLEDTGLHRSPGRLGDGEELEDHEEAGAVRPTSELEALCSWRS